MAARYSTTNGVIAGRKLPKPRLPRLRNASKSYFIRSAVFHVLGFLPLTTNRLATWAGCLRYVLCECSVVEGVVELPPGFDDSTVSSLAKYALFNEVLLIS